MRLARQRVHLALGLAFVGILVVGAIATRAQSAAPAYYEKTTIPIPPWASLENISVDISWVDPVGHTLVIADRTGNAVEVIDTQAYRFLRAAGQGQFAGRLATADGGPNGVAQVSPTEAVAGDGDSTLKLVNLVTGEVVSISTGGTHRADELAYDPSTDIVMVANDREDDGKNFVSLIKIHPLEILGQIDYSNAPGGLEQPVVAPGGHFYQAVPASAENPGGEIDVIDEASASIERRIAVGACRPTGLVQGVGNTVVTSSGCVVNTQTGTVVARIEGAGGDEAGSVPPLGVYAFVVPDPAEDGAFRLNVADGGTNAVYQSLPAGGGHNLAGNWITGEIFVPDPVSRVVRVFAPLSRGK
jgi:hypothetical protein